MTLTSLANWQTFSVAFYAFLLGYIIGSPSISDRQRLRLWPYMLNTLRVAQRKLSEQDASIVQSVLSVAEEIK